MKKEAVNHTKMGRLMRRLKLPRYSAVGILEALWHATGTECPAGNIGKLTDEDIAIAIDWQGDASELVVALQGSGWLDLSAEFRLVVHDWWDHAPDHVHSKVARAQQFFVCGKPPKLSGLNNKERGKADEFYANNSSDSPVVRDYVDRGRAVADPNLTKPNLTKPNQKDKQTSISVDLNSAPPNEPATSPQTDPEPPDRNPCPSGPVLIPDKRMEGTRTRGKPADIERIDRMRAALHRYMSANPSGTGRPEAGLPNPPDSVVIACLTAIGENPMDVVERFLHGLWKKGQRRGRSGGPNDYPWFITVLTAHFRDGSGAVLVDADPEPAGANA